MRYLFKAFFSRRGQIIWLVLLLLTPIILWLLPSDFFDGEGFVLCPSRLFFGIECYGCGMTRAVMHFHHFEFDDAVFYNMGVFLVYPAMVILWFVWLYKAYLRVFKPEKVVRKRKSSVQSEVS